jgi:hypothetical protein
MKKFELVSGLLFWHINQMILTRLTCYLCLCLTMVACKTQRTVLAGPTVTGLEAQGEGSIDARFSNDDPNGYLQNGKPVKEGKKDKTIRGLNAMSEKMFGGKLQAQSQKEFASNKNFLTREFGGKKDFVAKTWKGAPKNKSWTDKLFDTDEGNETSMTFHDAGRQATIKDSPDATKLARTSEFAGASRSARTSNYRPAERALEAGRDAPKLTSTKNASTSPGEKSIRDRIADSNASATEINQFLGKP